MTSLPVFNVSLYVENWRLHGGHGDGAVLVGLGMLQVHVQMASWLASEALPHTSLRPRPDFYYTIDRAPSWKGKNSV